MIGAWNNRIKELKLLVEQKTAAINEKNSSIKEIRTKSLEKYDLLVHKLDTHYQQELKSNAANTGQELTKYSPYHLPFWQKNHWQDWKFQNDDLETKLCVGYYAEQSRYSQDFPFVLPAFISFLGSDKTVILETEEEDFGEVNAMMESIVMRIALMYPHQAKFSFLDPAGFGKSFPISGQLNTRDNLEESYRAIEEIVSDMRRVITTYGLSDNNTFFDIANSVLMNEQLEFIFAANFPKGYDRRTIEKLQSISNNGTIAGKYLVIHHNTEHELPRDISMSGFEKTHTIKVKTQLFKEKSSTFVFNPDTPPSPDFSRALLQKLRDSKPPEKTIEWKNEINIDQTDWWSKSAAEFIETSIGRSGSADQLNIWFGAKKSEGNRPCSHGMLGAMTGSGKSNLYHVLILGLAVRYSPQELKFYLIDGKDGVEFQSYKALPHTEVLSLKSQPQLSRSILTDLIDEKERRNNLFLPT